MRATNGDPQPLIEHNPFMRQCPAPRCLHISWKTVVASEAFAVTVSSSPLSSDIMENNDGERGIRELRAEWQALKERDYARHSLMDVRQSLHNVGL